MIQIVYHRPLFRIRVEGHAMSGEAGHDLVCSGVTSLVYTLAVSVMNMGAACPREIREPKAELKEGCAEISCRPSNKYKSTVTMVFDTIAGGLEYLADNNPENISFEIRG